MGYFVKGDVVILPFPFTDLSGSKKRPAFVVANLPGDDVIVCQITSKFKSDPFALPLYAGDFVSGGLPIDSFIRPNKIFTADKKLILSVAGRACETKTIDVLNSIITIVHGVRVEP
ncbi:MAG: type II toxin-antitoxin system PemK/MazF family toxin [Treponema sp.]|nr:type II toxin-antitoxin system PemK/MazF family toxin [Treponema sp.]